MLRLEQVNGRNVWDILKLTVKEDQKSFVADNAISIIEAYTAITANGCAFPFGIYENETPVGFLMIGFDVDDDWDDAPAIAKGNGLKITDYHTGLDKHTNDSEIVALESKPANSGGYIIAYLKVPYLTVGGASASSSGSGSGSGS